MVRFKLDDKVFEVGGAGLAKVLRKMAGDESWRVSKGYRQFLVEMSMKCMMDKGQGILTMNQAKKVQDARDFYANWEKEKKSEKHLAEKRRQNRLLIKLRNTIRDADYNVKKIRIVESMMKQVEKHRFLSPKQKQLCNKFYKEYK